MLSYTDLVFLEIQGGMGSQFEPSQKKTTFREASFIRLYYFRIHSIKSCCVV